MRVIIDYDVFDSPPAGWVGGGIWPATWVTHPDSHGVAPIVSAFRLRFTVTEARTARWHVSADERYELYLDGVQIGRGPERGDLANWFYETYDVSLSAGEHTLVAHTWWLGKLAPYAQISFQPAFVLAAEEVDKYKFNTGHAPWETIQMGGYAFSNRHQAWATGANLTIIGDEFHWGFERGIGDDWREPVDVLPARNRKNYNEAMDGWRLRPALLPPMLNRLVKVGTARHVSLAEDACAVVDPQKNRAEEIGRWNSLLQGHGPLELEANAAVRVIVDLGDYFCAYPKLVLSGGRGSKVRIEWAESLYVDGKDEKANRDEVEGKRFFAGGVGDTFVTDGGEARRFTTLWWQAGRYLQIIATTGDSSLVINSLVLRETRYPLDVASSFETPNDRISDVTNAAIRAIEMCSHETFVDCPYYEQMMYVGDARLEALVTYALSSDDRLARKALSLFDWSRDSTGLTTSRYPSRVRNVIAPFSLWWIGMVHDYAFWRDDLQFVRTLLPGVRAIVDAYVGFLNSDGLIQAPHGWNFMDWVPSWSDGAPPAPEPSVEDFGPTAYVPAWSGGLLPVGVPPDASVGVSGVLNWHFIYSLGLAEELETIAGEPEFAARNRRLADKTAERAVSAFFDGERGMFADDLAHTKWSEHSQCLSLLSFRVPMGLRKRVAKSLTTCADLERTTIYFTHYLFETYRIVHRPDALFERLEPWFNLRDLGFKTTFECPEPSRSDCHGWGAHPIFHYYATILGMRPMKPGFKELRIEPQLGPLDSIAGAYPHPAGTLGFRLERKGKSLVGEVTLPTNVKGVIQYGDCIQILKSGRNTIYLSERRAERSRRPTLKRANTRSDHWSAKVRSNGSS